VIRVAVTAAAYAAIKGSRPAGSPFYAPQEAVGGGFFILVPKAP
jgi:hypothetical protein